MKSRFQKQCPEESLNNVFPICQGRYSVYIESARNDEVGQGGECRLNNTIVINMRPVWILYSDAAENTGNHSPEGGSAIVSTGRLDRPRLH